MNASDVITRAARSGLVLDHAIVTEALGSVDVAAITTAEKARYEAKVWDGSEPCPVGESARWLHLQDMPSRSAKDAFVRSGVVYFLLRDGELLFWQPFRADAGPSTQRHMVVQPGHPDHWETAAQAHIDAVVAAEADRQVYEAALDKALALHSERKVPVGAATQVR